MKHLDLPNGLNVVGTEAHVCEEIARRQRHGLSKYGTTVAQNPLSLREWLQHAYEECLDQAIYLKRAMEEIDKGCLSLEYPEVPTLSQFDRLTDLLP